MVDGLSGDSQGVLSAGIHTLMQSLLLGLGESYGLMECGVVGYQSHDYVTLAKIPF